MTEAQVDKLIKQLKLLEDTEEVRLEKIKSRERLITKAINAGLNPAYALPQEQPQIVINIQ